MRKTLFSEKIICIIFVLALCGSLFTGCSDSPSSSSKTASQATSAISVSAHSITGKQAKEMLDTDSKTILIDLRSVGEFNKGHIEGAVQISFSGNALGIIKRYTNKNAKYIICSNDANESKYATAILLRRGYVNVYNLGELANWPYGLVTE